jgi:hypothetical protein
MTRANYIGVPAMFNLNQCCRPLVDAYGANLYLVGSSLERRDFRDVDIRCILDDDEFDRMFPGIARSYQLHPLWSVTCSAISEWLGSRTGLPIDFQIQKRTDANTEFEGKRQAIGLFFAQKKEK